MAKLYFQNGAERCYDMEYHKEFMVENGLNEMEVFEAKPEKVKGYFFCKEFEEVGQSHECCGKSNCKIYKPRNGKSGICKHHGALYEPTDKKITITL